MNTDILSIYGRETAGQAPAILIFLQTVELGSVFRTDISDDVMQDVPGCSGVLSCHCFFVVMKEIFTLDTSVISP
jgi:hypothetical protein